jgi:cytochrome c peroxidase
MLPIVDGGTGSIGGSTGQMFPPGMGGVSGSGVETTCGFMPDNAPPDPVVPNVVGQAIAVAFSGNGEVIVQSREPAVLSLPNGSIIMLSTDSREDTGHTLFHANSGGGIACASCHAEGNDDGRVWSFACEGPRRTQSLQTGLAGTEPFHWDGNEHDFPQLVVDVFSGRMSGPALAPDQVTATLHWLDAQPRPHEAAPADPNAVARGQVLFNDSTRAACSVCHAGAHMTNNVTVDVGTGGAFQVPSLIGLGMRGPYMHNGCATKLADRFIASCGGGDRHGGASLLSSAELSDLVAYLQSL